MCSHMLEIKVQMWARPLRLCPPEATRFWGETDMQADYFSPVWWVLWWRGHRHVISLCYKRFEGHVCVHLVSCVLYNKIQKPKCGVCTREDDDFLHEGLFKKFISNWMIIALQYWKVVVEWKDAGILGLQRRTIQSGAGDEAWSLRAFV